MLCREEWVLVGEVGSRGCYCVRTLYLLIIIISHDSVTHAEMARCHITRDDVR